MGRPTDAPIRYMENAVKAMPGAASIPPVIAGDFPPDAGAEKPETKITGPRLVKPEEKESLIGDGLEFTDVDNAKRLVRRHGQDIRYCPQWKRWFIWDGVRWRIDDENRIVELAKDTARQIQALAGTVSGRETAEKWFKFALSSQTRSKLEAMITLAASDPAIVVRPEQFDSDPHVLNCLDGTIDLRTGAIRPHRREDLISKIASVRYDPESEPVHWLEFLRIAMHRMDAAGNDDPAREDEIIAYLQRAFGYSLTGLTTEAAIFILYGSGDNGKSVFTWTEDQLLGEYACSAEPETLMAKKRDGSGPSGDVARLKGARLVRAAESDIGHRLNESLLKRMTGGEKLVASFKYGQEFEFLPEFKIWMPTNHKPVVRGTDKGIWRRLKLVPFTVDIPKSLPPERQKDRLQVQAELAAELPAILGWAVKGAVLWYQSGLKQPDEITAATQAYRQEMDTLANFIAECCVIKAGIETRQKRLFDAYQRWCEDNNEYALNARAFGIQLGERGFEKKINGHGLTCYLGIGLVDPSSVLPESAPQRDPADVPF